MEKAKYQIFEKTDIVTLIPTTGKILQTFIFIHGWGQTGPEWIDFFLQGTATPEVKI